MILPLLLLVQPYIALGPEIGRFDPPLADILGVVLIAVTLRRPWRAIGWPAAAAFLICGALSALLVDTDHTHRTTTDGVWWLIRNPLFLYVAYGLALPAAIRAEDPIWVRRWLERAIVLAAVISLGTSLLRFGRGLGAWWTEIDFLTPNHKTLAVWLAPWVPVLRDPRIRGLVAAALILSLSKASWIVALVGIGFSAGLGWAWLVGGGAAAVLVLAAIPWLVDSPQLQDAARSRHSLNLRQWHMFTSHPLLGSGPGTSLGVELVEFPHYRINGGDAHGLFQKFAGELGVMGLVTWTAFTGLLFREARALCTPENRPWLGVLVCLHVSLLFSTEAFTHTHWIPLGIALGQLGRR